MEPSSFAADSNGAPAFISPPDAVTPALPSQTEHREAQSTLAPWYHTLGIVLLLLLYSFVAHFTHRASGSAASGAAQHVSEAASSLAETPKVPLYCSTSMLSWMLLASVVAGLYHRRAFFRDALQRRFRSRWIEPVLGLGVYLSFFLFLASLMSLITMLIVLRTHTHIGSPQEVAAVQERVQHMLHFDCDVVAALAPHTWPQMLLWTGLSFTAGFCEEHIFRGYLLRQSLAAAHTLALKPWLAAVLSVVATSLLFGSLHLYEGVGGAVVITLLGMLYAGVALWTRNLRTVIVAHFLQDFIGGLVYFIAHLRHAI